MTAQSMLEAIIQAMDEKLTPVIDRLDNLEERIQLPGSAGYEEALSRSIDAKLSPVLERLDRVEEQLRELTGAPEPEGGEVPPVPVVVSMEFPEETDQEDLYGEYDAYEDYDVQPDEPWYDEESFEEYEAYVRDVDALLGRLNRLEERLMEMESEAGEVEDAAA